MLNDRFVVEVHNAQYQWVAQLDDFQSLECVERHLGLGSWVLEAHFGASGVDRFITEPGSRLVVKDQGRIAFSGPLRAWRRERSLDGGTEMDVLRLSGWDDMTPLHARVIHPQPTTASPPFNTASHLTYTDVSLTQALHEFISVNAGPDALVARRWPGLTIETINGGPVGTWSARWRNLLEFVNVAAGTYGATVLARQRDEGIVVSIYPTRDRTDIELSPGRGTLRGWVVEASAPEMTAGWAGGQGDLEDRTVAQDEAVVPPEWPWRVEKFVNYGNAADVNELGNKLDEALAEGAAATSLELVPAEGELARYGVDFDLGDIVTVVVDNVEMEERITSATLRIDGEGGSRSFTVGPEKAHGPAAVFDQVRRLGARVRELEGR